MHRLVAFVLVLGAAPLVAQEYPGKRSEWHGYARHDFVVAGRKCILVAPQQAAPGRPWIWRARFFGHQPGADRALLARGYHLAYCDVAHLYGAPTAVKHWNAFYAFVTERLHLAAKVALEGMSRGGLIIHNWAKQNPDKVACIYGDNPVCDFRSWPMAIVPGKRSDADTKRCLQAYGINAHEAVAAKQTFHGLAALAQAAVPVLHVVGTADRVVPAKLNSALFVAAYRKLGGPIQVIEKPGKGHHPHALPDPRPIVEFVVHHCRRAGADRTRLRPFRDNVIARGGLRNARSVFHTTGKGHVAFLGGSITEMHGYRPLLCERLQRRFKDTRFTFTNAGIASTCSTTGAFRLATDVLAKGPVDLLFVEFAVNDDQDAAHARTAALQGMEGIVRRVRQHNPAADIVVLQFVNQRSLATLRRGEQPLTVTAHEAIATHYGLPTIHVARELADRTLRGTMTFRNYGGTHPKRPGNEMVAAMVGALFERCFVGPARARPAAHPSPAPVLATHFGRGAFLPVAAVTLGDGFTRHVPDWKTLPGSKRARFREVEMVCGTKPGATLKLQFTGTAIGAYVCAGPDAGQLTGTLDGKPIAAVDLYHRFSRGLHYPRTVMFKTDLAPGPHTLELRVGKDTSSRGHAARIMHFVYNADPNRE